MKTIYPGIVKISFVKFLLNLNIPFKRSLGTVGDKKRVELSEWSVGSVGSCSSYFLIEIFTPRRIAQPSPAQPSPAQLSYAQPSY